MINGAHFVIGSADPDGDRAFLRDVLGFTGVDAGGGWLIFALPPSEVAVHPGKEMGHQLFLMCDDVPAAIERVERSGATVKDPITEQSWGTVATFILPGGGEVGIYTPRHARP